MTSQSGTASVASTLPPERYTFGPFRLDTGVRKLWREGEEIPLPSRAFDTLAHLVRHRDRPVDKDELIAAVWAGAFVSDDSLVHCVSVLRRVLQDDAEHPRFIVTLPRRGYQFIGEASVVAPGPDALPGNGDAATRPTLRLATANGLKRTTAPFWVALAGVAIVAFAIGSFLSFRSPNATGGSVLLAQLPPPGTTFASGGILSPDARHLAFVARDQASGITRVWVRSLDLANLRAIAGTEGASKPFWSPDGQSIGYFAGEKLKTVGLVGEAAKTIASVSVSPAGGSWNGRGVIVFGDTGSGMYAVNAAGGPATALTTLDPAQDGAHAWPSFLPDDRHFLFTITSWSPERAGIWVGSLDKRETPRRVAAQNSPAVFARDGYLLYVADGALMAAPFDAERLELNGEPVALARNVSSPRLTEGDVFSISGTLLSFRGGAQAEQLAWFTRAGQMVGSVEGPTTLYNPKVSPDGTQLLATGSPARDPGLWLVDLKGNASTRLASDGIGPLWSPDGQRIAYTARGGLEIRVRSAMGQPEDTLLLRDDKRKVLLDWSPDGRYLVYNTMAASTNLDIWLLPLGDTRSPLPLLRTAANERQAQISPDGRWLAYTSDESGNGEVYVEEFPGLGSKRAVSVGGGAVPSWRGDGKELFYLSPDRSLQSVTITRGEALSIGPPKVLFRAPVSGDGTEARNQYVAAASGQTFLLNVTKESGDRAAITVVVNWTAPLNIARAGMFDRAQRLLLAAAP